MVTQAALATLGARALEAEVALSREREETARLREYIADLPYPSDVEGAESRADEAWQVAELLHVALRNPKKKREAEQHFADLKRRWR